MFFFTVKCFASRNPSFLVIQTKEQGKATLVTVPYKFVSEDGTMLKWPARGAPKPSALKDLENVPGKYTLTT